MHEPLALIDRGGHMGRSIVSITAEPLPPLPPCVHKAKFGTGQYTKGRPGTFSKEVFSSIRLHLQYELVGEIQAAKPRVPRFIPLDTD